jgi:hypothetical protein
MQGVYSINAPGNANKIFFIRLTEQSIGATVQLLLRSRFFLLYNLFLLGSSELAPGVPPQLWNAPLRPTRSLHSKMERAG